MPAGEHRVSLICGEQQQLTNQYTRAHRVAATLIDARWVEGNRESNRNLARFIDSTRAYHHRRRVSLRDILEHRLKHGIGCEGDAFTVGRGSLYLSRCWYG